MSTDIETDTDSLLLYTYHQDLLETEDLDRDYALALSYEAPVIQPPKHTFTDDDTQKAIKESLKDYELEQAKLASIRENPLDCYYISFQVEIATEASKREYISYLERAYTTSQKMNPDLFLKGFIDIWRQNILPYLNRNSRRALFSVSRSMTHLNPKFKIPLDNTAVYKSPCDPTRIEVLDIIIFPSSNLTIDIPWDILDNMIHLNTICLKFKNLATLKIMWGFLDTRLKGVTKERLGKVVIHLYPVTRGITDFDQDINRHNKIILEEADYMDYVEMKVKIHDSYEIYEDMIIVPFEKKTQHWEERVFDLSY